MELPQSDDAEYASADGLAIRDWYGDSLSIEDCLTIEHIAAAFETNLRSGGDSSIRESLDLLPADQTPRLRAAVFRILVQTQIANRTPTATADIQALMDEYRRQFPEFVEIIDNIDPFAIFDSSVAQHTAPHHTTRIPGGESPQRFGEYEIIDEIARGGMGVVYRARHSKLNRIVALKVIAAGVMQHGQAVPRFEREMECVGRLDHPNIVRASDAREVDGIHFLVMDYVEGRNLSQLIRDRGRLPVPEACRIIRDAAFGLQHVHEHRLVHRDLKPGNLMLTNTGEVRILDLGLARLNRHPLNATRGLTGTGELLGTIDFMSPEQADNTQEVDIRADIYSLGATLFALLVGHAPFAGREFDSHMKRITALATRSAPSVCEFRNDVPVELAAVLGRMLDRLPERRYQTPRDVADSLAPFCVDGDAPAPTTITSGIATAARRQRLLTVAILVMGIAGFLFVGPFSRFTQRQATRPIADEESSVVPGLQADSSDAQQVATVSGTIGEPPHTEQMQQPADQTTMADSAAVKRALTTIRTATAEDDDAWTVLSAAAPPDLRCHLIHTLAASGVPAPLLIDRLKREPLADVRSSLLLALGEYDDTTLRTIDRTLLLPWLLEIFRRDADPGVHSAADWLLHRWNFHDECVRAERELQQQMIPFDGGWYTTLHGPTMVVFAGRREFLMGSPEDEFGRFDNDLQQETRHREVIQRTFAISTKEMTRELYWRVVQLGRHHLRPANLELPHNLDCRWHDAAEFCNRLSYLEGIPPSEHCYEANPNRQSFVRYVEKPNALELTGYRLPTDAEWEYACRAGQLTARPFGNQDRWLSQYASCGLDDATARTVAPGTLKPNDFGMFEMLGNVSEWCHDLYIAPDKGERRRRLRGGSAWTPSIHVRSAARFGVEETHTMPRMGLRIARTLRRESVDRPFDIEFQVGPPAEANTIGGSTAFDEPQFLPLTHQQVIRLGTWERGHVAARRFRLMNRGSQRVTINAIESQWFKLNTDARMPTRMLQPGDHWDFDVQMTNAGTGARSVEFHCKLSVDEQHEQLSAILAGRLTGAVANLFEFENGPHDFGRVPVRSRVRHAFSLVNVGDDGLKSRVTQVDGPFRLIENVTAEPLHNSQFAGFVIEVDTSSIGFKNGTITVETSDGAAPRILASVQATVSANETFPIAGVYRAGTWAFDFDRDGTLDGAIEFGTADDQPITGDWNGDGLSDIGICRHQDDGTILWKLLLRTGQTAFSTTDQSQFVFGQVGDTCVVADIDGDGNFDPGTVAPAADGSMLVWKFDTGRDGATDITRTFGQPGQIPIVGNWDGGRCSSPGCLVKAAFDARNATVWKFDAGDGNPDAERIVFGDRHDFHLAGDWDGDGRDEAGVVRPAQDGLHLDWLFNVDDDDLAEWELRNFGKRGDIPVVLSDRVVSADAATTR